MDKPDPSHYRPAELLLSSAGLLPSVRLEDGTKIAVRLVGGPLVH
jgi:hypothetical protein